MNSIKALTIENLSEMTELFISVFTKEPWNEIWNNDIAAERLEHFLNHPKKIGFGFWENDQIKGFALGNIQAYQTSHYFYLEEMCVDTGLQGKGIGTKLWKRIEEAVKEQGINSMSFLTLKDSPAQRFYEKQGCTTIESVPFMKKDL